MAIQLWPKAHPLFGVWMAYCAVRWVGDRKSGWFAGAVVWWLAGMYTHIEMAPFLLMLPALWWRYRPPITAKSAIAAIVVGLVMWSPYLAFESGRGFIDLRSQLSMRPLNVRGGEVIPWCGDTPVPAGLVPASVGPRSLQSRAGTAAGLSLITFDSRIPGGWLILLGLLLGAIVWASGDAARALALCSVVIWIPLLLLTEPGLNRMIGLWPLQLTLITALVMRPGRWLAVAALLVVVAVNSETLWHARGWKTDGWSGIAPNPIYAADFRSARCEEERR
jgi:hypothetical protein